MEIAALDIPVALPPPREPGKPERHPKPGAIRKSEPRDARSPARGGIDDGTLAEMAESVRDRVTIGSRETGPSGRTLPARSRYERANGPSPAEYAGKIVEHADGIRERVTITGPPASRRRGADPQSPGVEIFAGIRGRVALAYALAP